jgi:hypothetical protein
MVLKVIAYGPYGYVTDFFDALDGALVVTSYAQALPTRFSVSFINCCSFLQVLTTCFILQSDCSFRLVGELGCNQHFPRTPRASSPEPLSGIARHRCVITHSISISFPDACTAQMLKKSVTDVFSILVVVFLFLFIYTVLGRQLFSGTLHAPPAGAATGNCIGPPGALKARANYDSFLEALVTTFQVNRFSFPFLFFFLIPFLSPLPG